MASENAIADTASGRLSRGHASSAKDQAIGSILFVITAVLAWVSVNPFRDLTDPKLMGIDDTSNPFKQIAYVAVSGCVVAYVLRHRPQLTQVLLRPIYLVTLLWLLITSATSDDPLLSMRRVVFTDLVILLAAALPLLPVDLKRFSDLIATAIAAVIVLCFAGVLLVPLLAIHQPDDIVGWSAAGDWRGIFPQKNVAGSMMVLFVFIGLFIARVRSAILGWLIVIASTTFLVFCAAKTAILLLPFILMVSSVAMRLSFPVLRAGMLLGVLAALGVVTLGSLYSNTIAMVTDHLLPDPSFTGRTTIWRFAIDHLWERPVFGHGFGAFWGTNQTAYPTELLVQGLENVAHSHNAFLDLVLTTGIPGLALGSIWAVIAPIRDANRCVDVGAPPALTELFMRFWLFGLYCCCFESVLFHQGDPVWFTMLVGMFGMRYLSIWRLVE